MIQNSLKKSVYEKLYYERAWTWLQCNIDVTFEKIFR